MLTELILSLFLWDLHLSVEETVSVYCLSLNVYYESSGEPLQGKLAVANVTRNRVLSKRHPQGYCDVIFKPKAFSWTNNNLQYKLEPKIKNKKDLQALRESVIISALVVLDLVEDNTSGALHYYNPKKANPGWAKTGTMTAKIKNHTFMRNVK